MSSYSVSRSLLIPAPATALYPLVANFHTWVQWSPWENLDPAMQRRYEGPDEGVGARYLWQGTGKAGAGSMEITDARRPDQIAIRLEFSKPMKALNPTTFTFTPEGAGTRVTWAMTGENKGVGRLFMLFMNVDKMVGGDFEKGLAQLGRVATQTP